MAQAYLLGGARLLQIRAKRLPSAAFLALCDTVVREARPYGATVIVNDRADLARMSAAGGVHVGQEDLSPTDARSVVGPSAIVGLSTHTLQQIEGAREAPVSYVAVGPIFGTASKDTGYAPVGLELVRQARARLPPTVTVVAIGGITLEHAPAVLAAGASQVAVIGDLLVTGNPRERAAAYCQALM